VLRLRLTIRGPCCFACLIIASLAGAQPVPLRTISLEQAMALAEQTSETVFIAQANVVRAEGQRRVVRSGLLPQLTANLN
jgi:outer membrane protein TolC